MKLKLFVLILFVFLSTFLHAQFSETITWEKTVIDDGRVAIGALAIGKPYIGLFPTSQNYLYCSSVDSHLVEYRYVNNQWIKDTIVPDMNFQIIEIGNGRNDNHDRIYTIENKSLYEIWHENFSWHTNLILEITDTQLIGIVIGSGRNDNINRVYITDRRHNIFELTFIGPGHNDWQIEIIDQDMYCQAIGQGRNDGVNRIYGFGGDCDRTIYELTYNSISEIWEKEEIFTYITDLIDVPCGGLKHGKARNDDNLNRLYWFNVYNYINETTWNGSSWDNTIVEPLLPTTTEQSYAGPFIFASIENNKMFFVHLDGPVYSFVNNNYIWLRYTVGEVARHYIGVITLTYGDVRNINVFALYAVSLGGQLTEFYPNY